MTTGLWALVSGLPPGAVLAAVPPACRRAVDAAPPIPPRSETILLEAGPWPAAGAAHFVPSFAALQVSTYSVRLELSVRTGGAWTPWVAGATLGPDVFAPLPAADGLGVDVDVFRAPAGVEAVRLRARLRAPAEALPAPWLLALSAAETPPPGPAATQPSTQPAAVARLDVPAVSQHDADAAIAHRICSPTCVAMVLGYWGRPVSLSALAAEMFHPATDLYGVWPAAIAAAARRGLAGYLLRFPGWSEAAWCLRQGLPLIASIRYRPGELTNAAIPETPGHLIVLTGQDGDDVLANDPAAPAPEVPRRYPLADIHRVWLDRTAIAYVLFPPDLTPPPHP